MKKIKSKLKKIWNSKIDKKNINDVLLFFAAIVILTVLLKSLVFYSGFYFAPRQFVHDLNISVDSPTTKFLDKFEKTKGTVLFDMSHQNNFNEGEIDVLVSRIIDRGNKVEFLNDANDLDRKLRQANSFVVILPQDSFSDKESVIIKDFTNKNGKLLLISDPDRPNEINSLGKNYNIVFSKDYLYNHKENDGNFKFIFLNKFKQKGVTDKLWKIALYTSCPILPFENGAAFTGRNTFSSSEGSKAGFTPIVSKESVVGVCDLTFFNQPYNNVVNNNKLISNIADFLTKPEKELSLADFPYFFTQDVLIKTTNLGLSKHTISLKNRLLDAEINAGLNFDSNETFDMIELELFDEFRATSIENLAVDENSFKIKGILFSRENSALVHLSQKNETILTILADNEDTMIKTLDLIEESSFRNNLVTDNIAVISGLEVEEEEESEE